MRVMMLCATPAFACPPEGYDKPKLQALKAEEAEAPGNRWNPALAMSLVDCLRDPDPELRDGIAYELLTHWMRLEKLDASMLRKSRDHLYEVLDGDPGEGFGPPFAALVLSEVARTDRITPWMTPAERSAMVDKAAKYLQGVHDYRGHDARAGWRHGVAHGADWLMQLALNPALDRAQAGQILEAVASQAVPASAHAYVFGEPERLARAVSYVAQRGLLSDAEWSAWFAALLPKLGDAKLAYRDPAWLARRHDLQGFLFALYLDTGTSDDARIRSLQPTVLKTVKAIQH